jgi:hypothetical protein
MRSLASRTGPKRTPSGTVSNGEESDGFLPARRNHTYERRAPRLSKAAQHASAPFESNTLLWLFLLVGLIFCGIDTLYIVHYVMRNPSDISQGTADLGNMFGYSHQNGKDIAHEELDMSKITNPEVARILAQVGADPDKKPVLQLLLDAKVDLNDIDPTKLAQIPKWSEVTALYGSEPVFVGLDTCQAFQNNHHVDPADHFVTTAGTSSWSSLVKFYSFGSCTVCPLTNHIFSINTGTFNTGTNLMAELLISNCCMKARVQKYGPSQAGVRWQVIWGKSSLYELGNCFWLAIVNLMVLYVRKTQASTLQFSTKPFDNSIVPTRIIP